MCDIKKIEPATKIKRISPPQGEIIRNASPVILNLSVGGFGIKCKPFGRKTKNSDNNRAFFVA
jgi:hypothetical protein